MTGLYLALIAFCAAVCALVITQTQDERPLPEASPRWLALLGGVVVLAAFTAFPSNPAEWSLGNLVLYLAEHTLNPLRILGVLMLGGGLFYAVLHVLYLSRRR